MEDKENLPPLKSPLAMTAEDHRAIGSTPPEILLKNPGKTRAELMSDEEIQKYLRLQEASIAKYENSPNKAEQSLALIRREDLELTVQYLDQIGRLPKE